METIEAIRGRNKEVLFVGGTPLYLKALLRGLFQGPPADWAFRKEVEAEVAELGSEILHQRLEMIDPVSAHQLHPNDHRRIIRALEVFKQTGKPISHSQMQFEEGRDPESCQVFTLRYARPVLHERIEQRVHAMFEAGLIEEVRALLDRFGALGRTASQAVGYREVIDHLAGKMDEAETIERVKIRTRRFARHQETWFRGMEECQIIDLEPGQSPAEIAQMIYEARSQQPLSDPNG